MKITPLPINNIDEDFCSYRCLDLRPISQVPPGFPEYSREYLAEIQERREERHHFFQHLKNRYSTYGLAVVQRKKIVGWLTFFPKEEARRIGWIRAADDYFNKETLVLGCLYVHEKKRNRGIGTRLIQEWMEWAHANYWRYLEGAARGNGDEVWYDESPLINCGFKYIEERITSIESRRSFRIYRCDLVDKRVARWVLVWADDAVSVEVVKSFLESHGIPTMLESDVVLSLHPFTKGPLGEVRVKVPQEMERTARELLADVHKKKEKTETEKQENGE